MAGEEGDSLLEQPAKALSLLGIGIHKKNKQDSYYPRIANIYVCVCIYVFKCFRTFLLYLVTNGTEGRGEQFLT